MTTPRRRSFIGMDPMLTDPPPATEPNEVDAPTPTPIEPLAGPRRPVPASQRGAGGKHAVSVRLHLGQETTERLEGLARTTGRDMQQLVRHLRRSVAADFRSVLAADAAPKDTQSPSAGASDRLHLVLSDQEYAAARTFFDPLGFGDHAMRDGMRPVLARLYSEWTLRIADR